MARAKNRNISEDDYVENHHIIPKCLGGNDSDDNMVKLTTREHYIAHGLLVKIYEHDKNNRWKLISAFRMMSVHNSKKRSGNRDYEWMRKLYSQYHPMKNPDIAKKSSKSHIGKVPKHKLPRKECVCGCGCGEIFNKSIHSNKIFINTQHHAFYLKNRRHDTSHKNKISDGMKRFISSLSKEELQQRIKNSLSKTDHTKRAKAISLSKKGKSTNQYTIMKNRYLKMSDSEIMDYIKDKTELGKKKILTLRARWIDEMGSTKNG